MFSGSYIRTWVIGPTLAFFLPLSLAVEEALVLVQDVCANVIIWSVKADARKLVQYKTKKNL